MRENSQFFVLSHYVLLTYLFSLTLQLFVERGLETAGNQTSLKQKPCQICSSLHRNHLAHPISKVHLDLYDNLALKCLNIPLLFFTILLPKAC